MILLSELKIPIWRPLGCQIFIAISFTRYILVKRKVLGDYLLARTLLDVYIVRLGCSCGVVREPRSPNM